MGRQNNLQGILHFTIFSLLLYYASAQCSKVLSTDEFLDRCESEGAEAGRITTRAACAALMGKCPEACPKPGVGTTNTTAKSLGLLEQVKRDACVDLFQSKCKNQATEVAFTKKFKKCGEIIALGPCDPVPGCRNTKQVRDIYFDAVASICLQEPKDIVPPDIKMGKRNRKSAKNKCQCAKDGVSNCIETRVRGCKRHNKDGGKKKDGDKKKDRSKRKDGGKSRFCYVVDSAACGRKAKDSKDFPDAAWMKC